MTTRSGTRFRNRYWPAVYFVDAKGRIRHQQLGEGGYEEWERISNGCCARPGRLDPRRPGPRRAERFRRVRPIRRLPVAPRATSDEQPQELRLAGWRRARRARTYAAPDALKLNQWALSGKWTIESGASVLNGRQGRIVFRFHARDVHLVMGPTGRGKSAPFRVLVDGQAPGEAHGLDVDEQGQGTAGPAAAL